MPGVVLATAEREAAGRLPLRSSNRQTASSVIQSAHLTNHDPYTYLWGADAPADAAGERNWPTIAASVDALTNFWQAHVQCEPKNRNIIACRHRVGAPRLHSNSIRWSFKYLVTREEKANTHIAFNMYRLTARRTCHGSRRRQLSIYLSASIGINKSK